MPIYRFKTFRVKLECAEQNPPAVMSGEEAYRFLQTIYADLDVNQEHCTLLVLNNKNRVTGFKVLFTGSATASIVDPKIVMKAAVVLDAVAIIIAHNHPSGDPAPSPEDIEITRRLKECCELFAIRFLDHVVLGESRYFSFSDYGMI
jgi:DNA repair protein RadC